ncbi:MAG: ABC transporter substrate-binding protein [Planctomycetota bacterium]|jgi:peptide/nickel transport system substrate-binding protein
MLGRSRATLLAMTGLALVLSCSRRRDDDVALEALPSGLDAKEAPMLADLVARGELPPLEERLPEKPLVARRDYPGYERAGVYGGTWRRGGGTQLFGWRMVGGYTPLIRWRFDCQGLEPGLAESWEFNEEGTRLVLRLRRGVRWSDGHPFTAESFAFFHELCKDSRNSYAHPVWSLVDGKPMTVETPDDWTIVMNFAGPNWLVPIWLATGFWESERYTIPKHYMLQFHPDHNPRYEDFGEFERRNLGYQNADRPSLWPWRLRVYEKGGHRIILERNPYYYVVDHLGRQLPYIDRVKSLHVPNSQVGVLKVLAGEVDCTYRGAWLSDLTLYLKGQRRGGYRVIRTWSSGCGCNPAILLNWSAPDPVLRKLIRDQRFRRALALGIDRDKCNEIAWRGLLHPQAVTVSRESWHFADAAGRALFDRWERTYAEFDIGKANALLDGMGLTRRDEDGFRRRPDGERLSLILDAYSASSFREMNDTALIVAEGWRALGIDVVIYTPPGVEMMQRRRLGKFTVSMRGGAQMDLFTNPDWVFPTQPRYWHPKVGLWYQTGGKKGEPPTGPMKRLLDIYDEMVQEPDLRKRHEYVRRAVRIHIDEGPFCLGTVGRRPHLVVASNRFHNVSTTGLGGAWGVAHPATSFPEQCFIQEERR